MVDLVKRLGDVKSTDAGCTTFVDNIINDTTNSTNSKTAANSLLKSELVVGRDKKMFENDQECSVQMSWTK